MGNHQSERSKNNSTVGYRLNFFPKHFKDFNIRAQKLEGWGFGGDGLLGKGEFVWAFLGFIFFLNNVFHKVLK